MRAWVHIVAPIVVALTVGSAQADASRRAQLELASREVVQQHWAQDSTPSPNSVEPLAAGRLKNGLWSLVLPGLSQYQDGHYTRAAIFFGAEVAIWTSYTVFRLQGSKRKESYQEYAQVFAGVQSTDHPSSYWLLLSEYLSSDDYNSAVRRDQRSGTGELGLPVTAPDSWRWISEERYFQYNQLRISSENAYSRSSFMTLFAVLNRVAAFLDGARSGGGSAPGPFDDPETSLHFDGSPFGYDPSASVGLRHSF